MVSSQMNILLSCAGRRNYMVDYFQSAVGGEGEVHVANNVQDLSSMAVCSHRALLPSIYDEDYIDRLFSYSVAHDIKLIVPLFDLELPILASHRPRFTDAGITIAVSTEEVCAICLDKVRTHAFLKDNGFETTPYFTEVDAALGAVDMGDVSFPMFVKPRIGMGSIGLYEAHTPLELQAVFEMVMRDIEGSYLRTHSSGFGTNSVIIQGRLQGTHYLLDVVNNFKEEYQTTFVKKPLSRWAGEANGATTVVNSNLEMIGQQLAGTLRHAGNADIDVFWTGEKAYILDINPRFGGGYPFSHQAGANLPAAYVAWAQGKAADPEWLTVEPEITSVKGISMHRISTG